MQAVFYYLTFIATGAVLVVLVLGILNLARAPRERQDTPAAVAAGRSVTNLSQQLMRWRVILQLVAIVVIMAAVALAR